MDWLITFPIEPNHCLHQEKISFAQVIGLSTGEIPSKITQTTRIFKMLMRYSRPKALQFGLYLPRIYWEGSSNPPLYYLPSEHQIKDHSMIAQWPIGFKKWINITSSVSKQSLMVKKGSEFPIFHDTQAFFNSSFTSYDDTLSTIDPIFNQEKKPVLPIQYHWSHDGDKSIEHWILGDLCSALSSSLTIKKIRIHEYEIYRESHLIALLFVLDNKLYLTEWAQRHAKTSMLQLLFLKIQTLAKQDSIPLFLTNQL